MPSTFIGFIHQRNCSNQTPVAEVNSFTIKLDTTEADKGQSQNIQEIRKNVVQIRKNISNRNVFMEIVVEEFIKSEKLLQILIKLLNPQILFCKSQTNCKSKYCGQIQVYFTQLLKWLIAYIGLLGYAKLVITITNYIITQVILAF